MLFNKGIFEAINNCTQKGSLIGMLKHIVISNTIMLLIPYAALQFGLFSNQIILLYQNEINIRDANI